jgi:hypothetical protein
LVERPFCTRKVSGSNPLISTNALFFRLFWVVIKILVIFEIFVNYRTSGVDWEMYYNFAINWKGHLVDALVSRGDEGGGRLP